jgi:hypothetical protein
MGTIRRGDKFSIVKYTFLIGSIHKSTETQGSLTLSSQGTCHDHYQ